MQFNNETKQTGVGLLELMLSLAVIAALILMATKYYLQAREGLQVSETIRIVKNIVDASFKWVEGEYNFSNAANPSGTITLDKLRLAGLVPDNYTGNFSPWSSSITVFAASPTQITIRVYSINSKACKSLSDVLNKQNFISSCTTNQSQYYGTYPAKP